MNLPNLLSLLRILLIPLFVLLFYMPMQWTNWLCAAVFGLAGVTDWLDGYLARKWNQTTPFGAFIDPVADKLMVVVALVLLVNRYPHVWFVLPTIVIICREIVVSALREWMAELGKRASVRVGGAGKVKTIVQMAALTMLIWRDPLWGLPIYTIGLVLLVVAAVLTMWSAAQYLQAAWRVIGPGQPGEDE